MKILTLETESSRTFNLFVRSRRANPQPNLERRERVDRTRRLREQGKIVASFGEADFTRHAGGRWELRSGSPTDHAEASVSASQSPVTKLVHNHILIADDDALVRGSLAAVLESEGFVVDEAQNGIEAVTHAIDHKPNLVLLDLNMPHWDGWTAFSQLDRVAPLLPVIVITARPNQYEKAVQLSVDAFMEKPLNIPILMRAIKRLISEEDDRHPRRITDRSFVTQLLGDNES